MLRRHRKRTVMLLLMLPLLLASCSSASEEADNVVVTRERIIETFKKETGHGLRRVSVSEEIREWAKLPRMERLDPEDPEQAERYGNFTIFVYEDREIRDHDMSGVGPPDRQGIYWYKDAPERGPDAGKTYWGAEKRYGENVLLTWWPESRKRELSAKWHRLDAVLKRATS
jgi:hypothetical protein